MLRASICLVLVASSLVIGAVAGADPAADEVALRALVADLWERVAEKTLVVADVHPDGCTMAMSQGDFWHYMTPDEVVATINESPNTLRLTPAYIEVRFMGTAQDVAYVSYYLTGTVERGELLVTNYRTRVSNVFEKVNGRWRMSAGHYSPLFGGSSTLGN